MRNIESLERRLLLAAPVILKLSDAIQAGDSFTINGGGITATGLDVAIAPDPAGQSPAAPPANAVHVNILQTDKDSQFAVCKMPAPSTPGVYNVWVKNADGWSAPYKLNAARALFQSEYQAYYSAANPITIEVVGRNFDQSEFGGTSATLLRLNNGSGGLYAQTITSLNPYHISFMVGNAPAGTYYVEVSNDNGAHWSRVTSGQTLRILATPAGNPDPLGLGVAWAKDFKWTSVFNVTSYGATGGDASDDTTAVQAAINAAEAAGGGVAYIPNGSYYLKSVHLPPGVVLQGQDQYATKIYYNGAGGPGSFIYSYSDSHAYSAQPVMQLQGIARLSILMPDPTNVAARPDVFINLGHEWGVDVYQRAANRMFLTNINLTYDLATGNSDATYAHRGIGALWTTKERMVFQNNIFVGWYATHTESYMNQYFICRNNSFEYSSGYVHDGATYAFFENNTVKIHGEYNQDTHGIFARSDAYVAGNRVEGAGDASNVANDGEGICNEPPRGSYNYGAVTTATATTLAVATKIALTIPAPYYGDLSVLIAQGTGRGQLRKVTSIDVANSVITVDSAFDIIPDSSSRFTLFSPLKNFTVYGNTISDCAMGILPYGNQYDCLVADNTLVNTVGIFVWAARNSDGATVANDTAGAFIRIARNSLNGVSPRSKTSAIGLYTGRFDGAAFYDTMLYSMEVRDNTITGDLTQTMDGSLYFPAYNGIYISSYIYSNMSDGLVTGDAVNAIIEGNHLSNLQTGIMLTKGDYGNVVRDNLTDSTVVQLFHDGGSQNTLLPSDNFSPSGLNISSQGAIIVSPTNPISAGASDINIIRDGFCGQLSPHYNLAYDDRQPLLQYQNKSTSSPYNQYFGYTFTGNRTFAKVVFVEGRHFSDGGWFANGTLKVQVRQNGTWVTVPFSAVRAYPNGNTQATFGTGFESYDFILNNIVGDGIRIYGTAGGTGHYTSISELEVWALPTPPASVSFAVNDGSPQRSMVNNLTITFDQPVNLPANALTLTSRPNTAAIAIRVDNPSLDRKTFVLSFSGSSVIGGSLPDGAYTLTLDAASVSDPYGQPLAGGNRTCTFHRRFGDVNGDRIVNALDANIFKQSLNEPASYHWYLDFDASDTIDIQDYRQMRARMVKPLL